MLKEKVREMLRKNAESNLKEYVEDILNLGCISGIVPQLVYYSDTIAFHDTFEEEIWDLLAEKSQEQGMSILEFINNLQYAKDIQSMTELKNLLAWFAFETITSEIAKELKITED